MEYEQDYQDWFPAVFGYESGGLSLQFVGSDETHEVVYSSTKYNFFFAR